MRRRPALKGLEPVEIAVESGRLIGARFVASPNVDGRPGEVMPDVLVIHNISLPPGEFGGDAIEQLFCNTLDFHAHPFYRTIDGLRVSAHLLIRRSGEVIQFVPFHQRAWHAGLSRYDGRERVNDFSIGIELEGTDQVPFEDRQYQVLARVTHTLLRAYPITRDRIVGHADIAPGRKTDPGPFFDWPRYRASI
jgi:N-acetyl-anhydromuramoyl-L-alanine amidase